MPGDPACPFVHGNYLFNADVLIQALEEDAKQEGGSHDFGGTFFRAVSKRTGSAYNFLDNAVRGVGFHEELAYWRDVGHHSEPIGKPIWTCSAIHRPVTWESGMAD